MSQARAAQRRAERASSSYRDVSGDPLGDCALWVVHCNPGHVDSQFSKGLTDLQWHDGQHYGHIMRRGGMIHSETGPRLANARNALCREFLLRTENNPYPSYLLMIDADMGFTPDAAQQLLDDIRDSEIDGKVGIVGGLCFGGGHSTAMFPTVYMFEDEAAVRETRLIRCSFYPTDQLFEVNGTGAAFTLISRELLVEMGTKFAEPTPFYAETVRAGTDRDYGEDIVFCLRAGALGWRILVDSRVKIDHYKRAKLNEDLYMQRLALMEAAGLMDEGTIAVEENAEGELVVVGGD